MATVNYTNLIHKLANLCIKESLEPTLEAALDTLSVYDVTADVKLLIETKLSKVED